MTVLKIQSSFLRTISEINDISILEEVRNAIGSIISIKRTNSAKAKEELTPLVKKICMGHSLDSKLDDKTILEHELLKKYL